MNVLRDLTIAALLALPLLLLAGPAEAEESCDLLEEYCPSMIECPGGHEVPQGQSCSGPSDHPSHDDGFTDRCADQGLDFDYETGECAAPAADGHDDEPATCDMDERSARGYCPDDADGHAAERDATFELEVPGPTTHAPEPAAEELPHTGAGDTVPVAVAGAAALAAGVAILRRTSVVT